MAVLRVVYFAVVLSFCGVVFFFQEPAQGAIVEHLVRDLPGQPAVNFSQYAGYLQVGAGEEKHLFYWFVEADHRSASKLPIAFWFNGGPGCSSVGDGLLTELGPFRVTSSGNLTHNKHSWNRAANVVFVESPVAVGFSYSTNKSHYKSFGDAQTARDAYAFLVRWFQSYPEYAANDMYIVGESYGGHYVPQLVQQVVHHNKRFPESGCFLTLKGFAVGNAWSDAYYDNKGSIEYFHSHSLISDDTYKTLMENCDFAHEFPIDVPNTNPLCNNATQVLYNEDLSGLNVYNIYGPSCNLPYNNVSKSMSHKIPSFPASAAIDPCLDYVTPYLNNDVVKRALHVPTTIEWTECSNVVFNKYNVSDILASMIPVYRELLHTGLKIMVYSGDFDGRVPTTGTRAWINELHLAVMTPWYPWVRGGPREPTTGGGQISGYATIYEKNFTFATVRAAGHLVPADQPQRALALFRSFLQGQRLKPFEYPARP